MSSNVEECSCVTCTEWREVINKVCADKCLDYERLSIHEKVELYRWAIHTDASCKEHNWNIMRSQFHHARLDVIE